MFSYVCVLTRPQAGLFSAVTSAFIIEVQSHLQPDPNDETAALLRVLIYKIDNTTFGSDPPTLPQWTGPPRTIVQVQAILFASLAASLLSAFLAMLGKQWLNRYISTDMRGTAIERSQNRQRKLDGIVAWYFDHVMESLPLMLQIALLLLGCALSHYLWEINTMVASVVIAVTSFGMVFYLLIIIAGTASESCPYQTPGARILRHILLPALRSAPTAISELPAFIVRKSSDLFETSFFCLILWGLLILLWDPPEDINTRDTILLLVMLPIAPVVDLCRLGWAMVRPLVIPAQTLYRRFTGTPQTPTLDQRIIALDLRCISWMLQTSLDKAIRLSALEHLAPLISMPTNFNPALTAYCFDVFISCVNVGNRELVVMQGLEQLATISALCFFHAISHLAVTDPASSVLKDVSQRYTRVFPADIDFRGLRFSHTMNTIHRIFIRIVEHQSLEWYAYQPPGDEHTTVSNALVRLAQFRYQGTGQAKVPRSILRFALHSLSLNPQPPTSVVADCLSIIAIDLGCDVSNTWTTISDERCVHTSQISTVLTLN